VHESELAHFPRSLRCDDHVRLQSYFRRVSVAGIMPVHDPKATSLTQPRCDATLLPALRVTSDTLIGSMQSEGIACGGVSSSIQANLAALR
jgi:hypothetical protein